MEQARLYEMWEFCESLQTRIFNLERTIQIRLGKNLPSVEEKQDVMILREQLKRARYRAEIMNRKLERGASMYQIE